MPTVTHELPTHLDVEDRAFFGLTARQLGTLLGGAGGAYGLWADWPGLPALARAALAAACALAACALALVRPAGRGLDDWAFVALRFLGTPKSTTWCVRPPGHTAWRPEERGWPELPLRRDRGDAP